MAHDGTYQTYKTTATEVSILNTLCVSFAALSVRFLTKRYIGEYDHQSGKKIKLFPLKISSYILDVLKIPEMFVIHNILLHIGVDVELANTSTLQTLTLIRVYVGTAFFQ